MATWDLHRYDIRLHGETRCSGSAQLIGQGGWLVAGTQGFEPRYADPESAVLPLDDVPTVTLSFIVPFLLKDEAGRMSLGATP